jgi:hypothetical protein
VLREEEAVGVFDGRYHSVDFAKQRVPRLQKRAVDKIKARTHFVCRSGLKFYKIDARVTRNILQNHAFGSGSI